MKPIHYEPLPENFTHKAHGFDYSLIERIGDVAWYESRYVNGLTLQGYLVAIIRRSKSSTPPSGKTQPAKEELPRRSHFGRYGWFFMPTSKEIARRRFEELVEKRQVLEVDKVAA
ncbi:MAG: hypothetical protein CMI31_00740 [Opitutae bacterium]|nr:hypothetical protein [Opitutae bacterium]